MKLFNLYTIQLIQFTESYLKLMTLKQNVLLSPQEKQELYGLSVSVGDNIMQQSS